MPSSELSLRKDILTEPNPSIEREYLICIAIWVGFKARPILTQAFRTHEIIDNPRVRT